MHDRILLRFNTKWQDDPTTRKWRVLVNGEEKLARKVYLNLPCETVEEAVDGVAKFHLMCHGRVFWNDGDAYVFD